MDSRGAGRTLVANHRVGGLGYVPLTFRGLRDYRGYEVLIDGVRLDQAVHGKDFWQTDYDPVRGSWGVSYNIPRETGRRCRVEFRRGVDRQP